MIENSSAFWCAKFGTYFVRNFYLIVCEQTKSKSPKLRIGTTHTHTHTPYSLKYFDLIWVLFLAYAWETLEHYLEEWLAGEAVQYWFQWVEFWWNRFITDPLMLVLWYYIAKKFPGFVKYARVLSVIWLVVHIFIFPHSMYLQEFLKL